MLSSVPPCLRGVNGAHGTRVSCPETILGHRVMIGRRIASGGEIFELTLDIRQQATGADAKEVRAQPIVAKLLLHQNQPVERLLGRADAASRFEADLIAR